MLDQQRHEQRRSDVLPGRMGRATVCGRLTIINVGTKGQKCRYEGVRM